MSWLAAATNRVLETLASSAAALARSSSALSRVNSPVRSRTRRSSVALARSSASAAFTLGVMSVKVVTRPPSGMRFDAHFDHQTAFGEALEEGLGLGGVFGDAFGDEFVDGPGAALAVPDDVAQDVVERDADAGQFVRQIEDFAELAVPADQRQFLVEYRDALADVIERGLQDFAVVVDRRIGVVEQFQRGLGRNRALAQHQRQHEPRGRRPDRRGQQIFGVLQELEVGLGRRLEADAARRREAGKRSAGALLAEIAGNGGDQLADADRGAAEPKTRRYRRQRRGHEQIGLHPLDRGGAAGERAADIAGDIDRQTRQHAVNQRRQVDAEQRLRP